MTSKAALTEIKRAIENSPRNAYVAELHLQVIKYANELNGVTGREFCEALGIGASFGTEYTKMRKIAGRLYDAGLEASRI
ncbi:hypothetical protein [Agrobacterium larrymoorei]|uniref:HTH-like domain-containing protein n=1 Tax=Agrobacterium larrymoorei TaxID=160699 RepID=A0AAF0KDT4_9HYPH|nr:hypothetical protein [Agrobacterium larrymoorei]QYA07653.1 hypothetical protein J5285_02675 [Agrobacterium larrymoorei]WHA41560.1 hypothetical protein CFBP5477_002695 [Agrobacterium larrymoorei]